MFMPIAPENQKLQRALALHRAGRLTEAAKLYRQISRRDPDNLHALHYLGMVEAAAGNVVEAKSLMARSLSAARPDIVFIENYATLLCRTGDVQSAIQICRRGLEINHASVPLLLNFAISLSRLGRLPEALAQFDALLLLDKDNAAILNERGGVLLALKQFETALASFDRAVMLAPAMVEAHINRGTACRELRRYDEALAAYDKALSLRPDAAIAWLGRGTVISTLKRYGQALGAYDKAIGFAPDLADAWLGRANAHFACKSYDLASADYEKAIALNPQLADAWLGRGNIDFAVKHYDDALSSYGKALEVNPDFAEAWLGRGNVLSGLKRFDEAVAAYDSANRLKPCLAGIESARLYAKKQLCDWRNSDAECAHLLSSFREGNLAAYPFEFLSLSSSSAEQLQCAARWIAKEYPASATPLWQGERYDRERIHVAYVSADFNPHPVSYLVAGMFEHHDQSHFELTGISLAPADSSEIGKRVEGAFERFIDASMQSDDEVAHLIKRLQVDVLVDLNGFTGGGRTGIFARRSAPIQINYLGYPGTSGADYMDYIIADRIVIPEDRRDCYSEKVIYLPDCYLVNDAAASISDRVVSRGNMGLPPAGFVFCCFNNNFKITPQVFSSWMRILGKVEGSVLWLAEVGPEVARNLRMEAAARGVDPARLVFAERLPLLADHLARLRLADLFLDTLPYNAHATACHALWAGVPVLTCRGETFAGRVAASLLLAVNLPELITDTPETYESLAVELTLDLSKLAEIRRRLASNRLICPLFDTRRFTRHTEAAYRAVYERHLAGLGPDHVQVSRL
jgi:protein O-GlcNAc transferase